MMGNFERIILGNSKKTIHCPFHVKAVVMIRGAASHHADDVVCLSVGANVEAFTPHHYHHKQMV